MVSKFILVIKNIFRKKKSSEWKKNVLMLRKKYLSLPPETRKNIFPNVEKVLFNMNISLSSDFRARKRFFDLIEKTLNKYNIV
jgi:hypothetical protein